MVSRRKGEYLSHDDRLALGKRIHENEWPDMAVAARTLGRSASNIRALRTLYRNSIGLTPAERVSAGMKQHHASKREGIDRHLVPSPSNGHDTVKYETRIAALEGELAHALDECHTLQKILMAVGRNL